MMQGILYEEPSVWLFLLVTLVMGGGAAWMTGRAMAVFTMAMFLGVALMQTATGAVAAWAGAQGLEPYRAVLLAIAGWLALASLAFRFLPASPLLRRP